MAHHAHGYRITPDDEFKCSDKQWIKADAWINGLEFKIDFNEALALAKIGAASCRVWFIVQKIPLGGIRPKYAETWVIKH